jgi:2-dehydro-3-deoxyphosphogluconate aldolase/(4S)-4-hydroxy-2-oxoglutarate aldolase
MASEKRSGSTTDPGDRLVDLLGSIGVVPVVVVDDPAKAEALGHTLVDSGLPCAEVTLRTERALDCMAAMASVAELTVGAGTVTTVDQANRAVDAGATFVVSPGFSGQLAAWSGVAAMPYLPGVATSTEIMAAVNDGLSVVKFFPAGPAGGPALLRALAGPFPRVRFVPTGGIGSDNLFDYLAVPSVVACGGSWVVERSLVEAGRFDEISRRIADVRSRMKGELV